MPFRVHVYRFLAERRKTMGETTSQRIVEALPFLDRIAESVQPKVQEAAEVGGTTVRNALDGKWLEVPLHPVLTDVPVGSWTAALVFDGLDAVTSSRVMRNAADASLVMGTLGAFGAAVTGLSDWRDLSGGSRRMGVAHGLLNTIGLVLSLVSLFLRATGRRNAGRLTFLTGYSISGMAAHLGGELSYNYGLRVNRNAFEEGGPHEFVPVLSIEDLPGSATRKVEVGGVGVLLSRSSSGEVCAISSVCGHLGGPLEEGGREGDTVVCPWHGSRYDLCSGKAIDGPAVFPQSRYEARVRQGSIEVKAAEENVQEKVM
jgi:nitrite reductase/ring-hydroxylating ferredoxin subunit/uncharacterized membrane protein